MISKKALLIGEEKNFVTDLGIKFTCQYGTIDLTKAKIGGKIKSNKGYKFVIAEPSIIDLLRKCKRGPQIIMPKDAGSIVSKTGVNNNSICLDAGGGSGFLSLFLSSICKKVYTYEKEKRNYEIIKKNIDFCRRKNIELKNQDIKKFKEKDLDLIVLDMKNAEKMIKKTHKALKLGAWLVVYSPQIEQQIKASEEMKKNFVNVHTIENIQRNWSSNMGFTHPRPSGIMHTGFLTFGRKV